MAVRRSHPAYLFLLVFLLGIFLARLPSTIAQVTGRYDFFDPIIDVQKMLEDHYVEEPAWEAIQQGAIDGMLEALDDPYAQYIPPAEHDDFEKAMTGEFVGIGAEVRELPGTTLVDGELVDGGYLEIVSPLVDSPAFNAGLMAGDLVVEIEGENTVPLRVDDCIKLLKGQPGTPVEVVVQRDGERLDPITIVRKRITVRSVRGLLRDNESGRYNYIIDEENRIAYLRLTQFTPTAGDEVAETLDALRKGDQKIGGLILDLRDNPGGVLEAALQIANMFLDEGVILSVKGRAGNDRVHRARSRGTLPEFPIVVLVNGASASASEIVAGALQDQDRATVLGTRSFGKGLVQSVRSIPNSRGGQLKFTVQRYYLPSGRLLQRTDDSDVWGVDPTPGFYLPVENEDEIARLRRRRELDIFRNNLKEPEEQTSALELLPPTAEDLVDPLRLEEHMADAQLGAALKAMQDRVTGGDWVAISDAESDHGKIALSELSDLRKARERLLRQFTRIGRRIETLEDAADGVEDLAVDDLWDDEIELADGALKVYDKDGELVAHLKITGNDLERWLIDAQVEPVESSGDDAESTTP